MSEVALSDEVTFYVSEIVNTSVESGFTDHPTNTHKMKGTQGSVVCAHKPTSDRSPFLFPEQKQNSNAN
jgi:hypothetical protein